MGRKNDRTWAQRSEAVAALAESGKGASGAQVLAILFNSTPDKMQKEADALMAGIFQRKQAELERLTKELASAPKASAKVG